LKRPATKSPRATSTHARPPAAPAPKPAHAGGADPAAQRARESRNKANTMRNAAKVEHYLMEIEKAHGFAKSWALRERLETGEISLEDLMRR